jgi:hypothetical protein
LQQVSVTLWPTAFFRQTSASLAVVSPLPSVSQMRASLQVAALQFRAADGRLQNVQTIAGRWARAVALRLTTIALRCIRQARRHEQRG